MIVQCSWPRQIVLSLTRRNEFLLDVPAAMRHISRMIPTGHGQRPVATDLKDQKALPFEINPRLDIENLSVKFRENYRLTIDEFLTQGGALLLYSALLKEVVWRSFVLSDEELFAAPSELRGEYSAEQDRELLDCAYQGAKKGFAYLYEADRLFTEDIPEGASLECIVTASPLTQLNDFLNSSVFLKFIQSVTGWATDLRVAIQATRFRAGHFEMFHCATRSEDKTGRRLASFNLNLTPEWKPEWGGMLGFRQLGGGSVEEYVPHFNALEFFAFPQGHWISQVAPYAGGSRLAISGRLYASS